MNRLRIYLVFGFLAILSLGLAVSDPIAFQKLNTIVPADGFEALQLPDTPVGIVDIIEKAPIRRGPVATVDPAKKYRLTILGGGIAPRELSDSHGNSGSPRSTSKSFICCHKEALF